MPSETPGDFGGFMFYGADGTDAAGSSSSSMGRRRHPSARPIQRQAFGDADSSFGSVSLHEAVSLSGRLAIVMRHCPVCAFQILMVLSSEAEMMR